MTMRTAAQNRVDLHLALTAALHDASPLISSALGWLESSDRTLDIDDAGLAESNAAHVLASLALQGDGEMPLSVWVDAVREGAMVNDGEEWDAIEQRREDLEEERAHMGLVGMMIDSLRGDA